MATYLIDSHAHLTMSPLWEQIDNVIVRAQQANISHIVNISTNIAELQRSFSLSKKYPFILHAAATTPHEVKKQGEKEFDFFAKQAQEKTIQAIGETGLDYYYKHSSKDTQKYFLAKYFQLALETSLPVVIHCREAFDDLFALADAEYKTNNKWGTAVLHCFSGNSDHIKEAIKRGWFISVSGIVTFKNNDKFRQIVKNIPLNNLLIETDAPFLAPQNKRGKTNEPAYLVETAAIVANLYGISFEKLSEITTNNSKKMFLI